MTKLTNLIHLCWHHHFLVHEGGWTLTIRPDGSLRILDPNGNPLKSGPAILDDGEGDIVGENAARGLTIDHTTPVPGWYGESLDLDLAITALVSLQNRAVVASACIPSTQDACPDDRLNDARTRKRGAHEIMRGTQMSGGPS